MIIGTIVTRGGVERGLYEAIRKTIVAAGFLPDETLYASQEDYEEAKAELKDDLSDGQLIEVRGVGTSRGRDEILMNTIYLEKKETARGNSSGGKSYFFEEYQKDVGGGVFEKRYRKYASPEASVDITYQVRYFTDSTKYDRIVEGIIEKALGVSEKAITSMAEDGTPGVKFWVEYNGDVDLSQDKYFERMLRYVARDLRILEPELVDAEVKPMGEIVLGMDAVSKLPE